MNCEAELWKRIKGFLKNLVIAAHLPAQQPESHIDSSIIGQELVWLNQLLGEQAVLEVQGSMASRTS
jgi:hypothetical protein